MALAPTRYSRVSIGWRSSTQSLVDYDAGDTGPAFSVTGDSVFNGAQTQSGAQIYSSTLSVGGALTASAPALFVSTVTANSALSVGGLVTLTGATRVASTLTVGSNTSLGGTLQVDGAAVFSSTASHGGDVTATTGLFVGAATAINEIVAFSSVTTGPSFGAIGVSAGVSLVTVAMSGATRGDTIWVTPDSKWQQVAAHRYVQLWASSGSTTGEVNLWAVNSGLTAVTPTAGVVIRLSRINHPSYV